MSLTKLSMAGNDLIILAQGEISNKLCDSTLCTCGGVGGEEQVHNVDYDPVKPVGVGGGEQAQWKPWKAENEQERERRCLHHKSPDGTDTSSVM